MQLGWVDFSSEERDKALGFLQALQEQGAVDELGKTRERQTVWNGEN